MKINEIIKENDSKGRFMSALKGNQAVILAYGRGSGQNLDIRGVPVSLEEWRKVMNFALSDTNGQYNDFEVDQVADNMLGEMFDLSIGEDELKFVPAREYSVALYILGPENYLKELAEAIKASRGYFSNVNEIDVSKQDYKNIKGPFLRLWWD